ncbi:MAG: hypothetical protein JNM57_11850 [Cyclobacteriaceae bacterium]|nr:hypothetical protein [Cyclobacteriaceae bacterium]
METRTPSSRWTDESILDLIRKLRNDLIKDFLDERFLKEYFSENFNLRDISNVKIEFIKKDLKELLLSPVDTTRYQPIIDQVKELDSASIAEGNEQLFYKEIEGVLKRYAY